MSDLLYGYFSGLPMGILVGASWMRWYYRKFIAKAAAKEKA